MIFYSKILKNKDIFYILISFLIFFLLNHFNINLIYLNFLFLLFLITSLYFKNYIKKIFILLIFLYLFNFYEIINNDRKLIFIIIFISFINDTSAYLIGNYFKGPLIIPKISPKKTWSGTLGSFFISFLCFIYFEYNMIISSFMSISLFFGDIYFSYIKRELKIKDFSKLLKGHGGILDRIDSTFFVIPFISIILI